jgi:CHAT domain-containing protein
LTLKHAQLAYLSACQTVDNRDDALLDEGIHLAGACQLAGFPHVVATLWEIEDSESVQIAIAVYTAMMSGTGRMNPIKTAESLHFAVRQLREITRKMPASSMRTLPDDPLVWAPYIHMGA